MRRVLPVLAVLFLSVSARAWEASAAGIEERLSGAPSPFASMHQAKPGWASRIDRPEQKVHWTETTPEGETYVFGVGMARDIENTALRLTMAEERARASLIHRAGEVKTETVTLADGRTLTVKTAVLNGARIIDWFLADSGAMYALAVLEP